MDKVWAYLEVDPVENRVVRITAQAEPPSAQNTNRYVAVIWDPASEAILIPDATQKDSYRVVTANKIHLQQHPALTSDQYNDVVNYIINEYATIAQIVKYHPEHVWLMHISQDGSIKLQNPNESIKMSPEDILLPIQFIKKYHHGRNRLVIPGHHQGGFGLTVNLNFQPSEKDKVGWAVSLKDRALRRDQRKSPLKDNLSALSPDRDRLLPVMITDNGTILPWDLDFTNRAHGVINVLGHWNAETRLLRLLGNNPEEDMIVDFEKPRRVISFPAWRSGIKITRRLLATLIHKEISNDDQVGRLMKGNFPQYGEEPLMHMNFVRHLDQQTTRQTLRQQLSNMGNPQNIFIIFDASSTQITSIQTQAPLSNQLNGTSFCFAGQWDVTTHRLEILRNRGSNANLLFHLPNLDQ